MTLICVHPSKTLIPSILALQFETINLGVLTFSDGVMGTLTPIEPNEASDKRAEMPHFH